MRRSFALALTALLLVFTLTACGNRSNGSTQSPSASQSETSAPAQSGANGSDSFQSDQNTAASDAVDDVVDGVQDAVDDVLPDNNANTRQRGTGGVPYGDMMHNDRR